MNTNPFLRAIYASAWRELRKARELEEHALSCLLEFYAAGDVQKRARRLHPMYDRKRREHVARAMHYRRNASLFRQQLAALERRDTEPPPSREQTRGAA
jgi:hypothetical protein